MNTLSETSSEMMTSPAAPTPPGTCARRQLQADGAKACSREQNRAEAAACLVMGDIRVDDGEKEAGLRRALIALHVAGCREAVLYDQLLL